MKKTKILISAGGTGGHILPALSIAESLKSLNKALEIECVHGFSDLEKKIYEGVGFKTHRVSIGRLRHNVPIWERGKTFLSLLFILLKALYLVMKLRPTLVIGTGGAVSGPILLAGFLLRKKTLIFEPNVVPGFTNRVLSFFVNEVITVFPTKVFSKKKVTVFPYPVRSQISSLSLKEEVGDPLRVLILGGSQGSSLINKVVGEWIISEGVSSGFSYVHQTGEKDFEYFKNKYSGLENVKVFSFLKKVFDYYEWADVVIGRAGMGMVAELSVVGRASVLVPLASASDQHQLKNAQALEEKSCAVVIEEKDLSVEKLKQIFRSLTAVKISEMSLQVYKLKLGARADEMANYIYKKYLGER